MDKKKILEKKNQWMKLRDERKLVSDELKEIIESKRSEEGMSLEVRTLLIGMQQIHIDKIEKGIQIWSEIRDLDPELKSDVEKIIDFGSLEAELEIAQEALKGYLTNLR